eukprot:3375147-Rhodomonas_salina.1
MPGFKVLEKAVGYDIDVPPHSLSCSFPHQLHSPHLCLCPSPFSAFSLLSDLSSSALTLFSPSPHLPPTLCLAHLECSLHRVLALPSSTFVPCSVPLVECSRAEAFVCVCVVGHR